jgi:enoyl-[acyl-carrier protein] reductase III
MSGPRRVFITGGSGAIGRALAVAFAAAGARVAFTYFMGHDGMEETSAAIRDAGGEALPVQCNLRDRAGPAEAVDGARELLGGIDVFISNAATGVLKPLTEISPKSFQAVMRVNAGSFLEMTSMVAPAMDAGGRILALTSAGSVRALENYGAIGASKAALESLVRHFAMELGPRGITVNAIRPGVVDTPALEYFPNREQMLHIVRLRTPTGRIATPADVAGVALFLASEAASMINGETLTIDGGYSILA